MFQRNLSFLSVAFLAASLSFGAPSKGPERRDGNTFLTHLEKELKLSPTQAAQVREILKPDSLVPPPRFRMDGNGFPLAGEFIDQLRAPTVDTAALNRQFDQRLGLQRETYARAQSKFVQLHAVLDMEQRHKLADMLQKRLARAEAQYKKQDKKKK